MNRLFALKNNILFALFLTAFLVGIDFCANLYYETFYIVSKKFTLQQIFLTFIISFIISFTTTTYRVIISSIFVSFSIIQIIYYSFFRAYIQYYHIELIFSEIKDIIDSLSSIKYEFVILISILILVMFVLFKTVKLNLIKSKKVNIYFTLFLILIPIYAAIRPQIFITSPLSFSYLNMIYSNSLFIKNIFVNDNKENYKDYEIVKNDKKVKNVIFILGESLSYKYMGLYDETYKTTPLLDKLKSDENFQYIKSISAGVNTPVSVFSIFKAKREANNTNIIYKDETNLLKLANENNYSTYWLSTQEEGSSIASVIQHAKKIKVKKDYEQPLFDDVLIDEIENIDFSKENFIVLHMRANHSPYEKYTPKRFKTGEYEAQEYFDYKMNTYKDSIVYVDYILSTLITKIKEKNEEFIVYFTSDHGERMGTKSDNLKYGHSELDIEATKVPTIIYSNTIKRKYENNTHYELSKDIAKSLGYDIINPNEDGKTFFVNSTNINGSNGFLKFKKDEINW